MIRTAVIGIGNMGSKYASYLQDGVIEGMELAAVTRVKDAYRERLLPALLAGVPVYEGADDLMAAVEDGSLSLDAVIISTPHYSHEAIAVRAFQNGLHVLCEKPSGVYSRQARNMEKAAYKSGKVFGLILNQRVLPVHQELKRLVSSGSYGALKRVNWVVTDWYRPERYYSSVAWRGTWKTDGGGVLLNQCPHNLDLLQWICGMPIRVQGFCREGQYHQIEVEDDVTAYLEWENGATGTFITSTGIAPGINRLEIMLDEAMIVCEEGKIRIGETFPEMGCKESEYRKNAEDYFRKIHGTWREVLSQKEEEPYRKILQGFADECMKRDTGEEYRDILTAEKEEKEPGGCKKEGLDGRGKEESAGKHRGSLYVPGSEGRKSLLISNAIYLSSWEKRMISIPEPDSQEELAFEELFEQWLEKK